VAHERGAQRGMWEDESPTAGTGLPVWHARLRAPRRGRGGKPGGSLHRGQQGRTRRSAPTKCAPHAAEAAEKKLTNEQLMSGGRTTGDERGRAATRRHRAAGVASLAARSTGTGGWLHGWQHMKGERRKS